MGNSTPYITWDKPEIADEALNVSKELVNIFINNISNAIGFFDHTISSDLTSTMEKSITAANIGKELFIFKHYGNILSACYIIELHKFEDYTWFIKNNINIIHKIHEHTTYRTIDYMLYDYKIIFKNIDKVLAGESFSWITT